MRHEWWVWVTWHLLGHYLMLRKVIGLSRALSRWLSQMISKRNKCYPQRLSVTYISHLSQPSYWPQSSDWPLYDIDLWSPPTAAHIITANWNIDQHIAALSSIQIPHQPNHCSTSCSHHPVKMMPLLRFVWPVLECIKECTLCLKWMALLIWMLTECLD